MSTTTKVSPGRLRRFELQLEFLHYTEDGPQARDYLVSFDEATTVRQVIETAARLLLPKAGLDHEALGAEVTLRHKGRTSVSRTAQLPPNAQFHSCGLRNGSSITLTKTPASTDFLPIADVGVADLYLVDAVGPGRGRVTPLTQARSVIVGSDPDTIDGEWPVVIDDAKCPSFAFRLDWFMRGRTVFASLSASSTAMVLVNGVDVRGQMNVPVYAGSVVEIQILGDASEPETAPVLRVVTFNVTRDTEPSPASSETEAAFGRVRLEPAARSPIPRFGTLSDGQLPDRPVENAPSFNKLQAIVPLIMGLAILFFGGSPFFLLFAVSQPAVSLYTYWSDKKLAKLAHIKALGQWRRRREAIISNYEQLVESEQRGRRQMAPSVETWGQRVLRRHPELWERRSDDQDFLEVRLGSGHRVSAFRTQLQVPELLDDDEVVKAEHQEMLDRIDRASLLEDVPVTVSLLNQDLALIGPARSVSQLASSMILQVAAAHSPSTVTIAALLPADKPLLRAYEFLKWIPHVRGASTLLPVQHVALGRQQASEFLQALIAQLADRRKYGRDERSAHALIFVHEGAEVDQSLLAEVKELSDGLLHFVWLGATRAGRPALVTTTLTLLDRGRGAVDSADGSFEWRDSIVQVERVSTPRAEFVARSLAPLFDPRSVGASQGIPDFVPLSTVLDLEDLDYRGEPEKLRIPVGIDDSAIFYLDLVDDGPHILIGGTTNSGKSGLLQTIVASLTVSYPPKDVCLILIDFKGGLTFGDFEHLPHVVGYASDLDDGSTTRILDFIQAELKRRLSELSQIRTPQGRVPKDIGEYRGLVDAKEMPRLVVMVDEFATLVTGSASDKVLARIVDIAQRGRALGVHLLLATQQPSGQVISSQVKANVGAKIALRTVDAANSELIIDAPDAAQIPRALQGRALARLEGGRLVQFQAAFSEVDALASRAIEGALRVLPFEVVAR